MNYVAFIWTDGLPVPEALAVMQRELPPWIDEMDRRGVRLLGRELDLPETAATVRVREGEMLLTDGPFAETKEFIAGFDLLDCADLDEAIEVAGSSPVCRYHPIEIRPFAGPTELGEGVTAFAQDDDSAGTPYLLTMWVDAAGDAAVVDRGWRQDLQDRGLYVLGGALEATETATVVRVHDGRTHLSDGPFATAEASIADIEVIRAADRRQAIEFAAAHPLAREQAIEVRPFYSE